MQTGSSRLPPACSLSHAVSQSQGWVSARRAPLIWVLLPGVQADHGVSLFNLHLAVPGFLGSWWNRVSFRVKRGPPCTIRGAVGGRRRAQGGQVARLKEGGLPDARRLEGCRGAGSAAGAPEVQMHRAWRFFPASDHKDRPNGVQSAGGSARPPWSLHKCHPQVTAADVQTHSSHGALSRVGPAPGWAVSCVRAATGRPRSPVLADGPLLTPGILTIKPEKREESRPSAFLRNMNLSFSSQTSSLHEFSIVTLK